jgi:hypothetical protein
MCETLLVSSPGDRQMMVGLYQAYQRGQTHFQIGDNNNLFDYTYVGNVAQAHLLAADRLVDPTSSDSASTDSASSDATLVDSALRSSLHKALPPVSATTGFRRVPTCKARPLGPYVTPPPNATAIEAAFNTPVDPSKPTHVIVRSRFDQFSENALDVAPTNPLQVAGQAFFITNGEPVYFWDFMRVVWLALDPPTEEGSKRAQKTPWVIPRAFGMVLGYLAETWAGLIGKEALFTRYRVAYTCATRYHNIEKARRVLGYQPEVGLEEGVRRMVEVCFVCACVGCHTDDELVLGVQSREWSCLDGREFRFLSCATGPFKHTPTLRYIYTYFSRFFSCRILIDSIVYHPHARNDRERGTESEQPDYHYVTRSSCYVTTHPSATTSESFPTMYSIHVGSMDI